MCLRWVCRKDLIDFLLEEGADPTVRDGNGRTARDICEFYNHSDLVARFAEDTPVDRFHSSFSPSRK